MSRMPKLLLRPVFQEYAALSLAWMSAHQIGCPLSNLVSLFEFAQEWYIWELNYL